MPRYSNRSAARTTRATRSTRKARDMAVRPRPRPTASRHQIGLVIVLAVAGTLALAALSSARAGSLPPDTPASGVIEAAAANSTLNIRVPTPTDTPEPTSTPEPTPTPTATPVPTVLPTDYPKGPWVGIVAGHWGNDSGADCPDGTTEVQTNLEIAKRVVEKLRSRGIWTDLLQEFDDRLNGYKADLLLSIHADSCQPIDADPPASGFKVARAAASAIPGTEDRLVNCLKDEYQKATGMYFHEHSITPDMTSYHSFSEVDPNTPAAIIETGFLYLDYNIIVKQPDLPATGIANGILCFLSEKP